MSTQAQREDAYRAGRDAVSIVWNDDATDDQQTPGEHHCPFGLDQPEQRAAWLEGLADALEQPKFNPASIVRTLRDEIKVADRTARAS